MILKFVNMGKHVCEHIHTHMPAYATQKLVCSFYHVGLVDQTQTVRLRSKSPRSPKFRTRQNKAMPSEYDMLFPPRHPTRLGGSHTRAIASPEYMVWQ